MTPGLTFSRYERPLAERRLPSGTLYTDNGRPCCRLGGSRGDLMRVRLCRSPSDRPRLSPSAVTDVPLAQQHRLPANAYPQPP
jgi:hypothetical protein